MTLGEHLLSRIFLAPGMRKKPAAFKGFAPKRGTFLISSEVIRPFHHDI